MLLIQYSNQGKKQNSKTTKCNQVDHVNHLGGIIAGMTLMCNVYVLPNCGTCFSKFDL